MNFEDQQDIIKLFRDNEGYHRDMRAAAKECQDFVNKRDGQWEPDIISRFKGKPRYTDDRVNPIINQMVGEVHQAEFAATIRPASGDASKDTANKLNGLIRTILNKSQFDQIKVRAAKSTAVSSIAGWEIVKDYADPLSFDQDLLLSPLEDFHERVLLDPSALNPTADGAMWGIIKHYVGKHEFEEMFGEEHVLASLGNMNWTSSYYHKPESGTIGQLYYLRPITRTIIQMNDGSVYEEDDEFLAAVDELAEAGLVEINRRQTQDYECVQRWFSAKEWLSEPEVLDFNFVPIVPVYGNFEVTEGKITHFGAVERLMDPQRVHNYAFSRYVEEDALKPRNKITMTKQQAAGNEKMLGKLNTSPDPVLTYTHVDNQPPPFFMDMSVQNQSVMNLTVMTEDSINKAAGIFSANIGDNPGLQSGVAIQEQIDRGNNGTSWLFFALETAMVRTVELLLRAIPNTYDGTREVVLTQPDGSLENVTINEPVVDDETGQTVYLYDLTKGQYDVTVDVGKAYKNRQQESVEAFERMASTNPEIMAIGSDIHANNIEAPGFDKVSERLRAQNLQNGVIPVEQMSEEEQAWYQEQQSQPQQPDPNQIALEIEQMKAQTAMLSEQNTQTLNQIKLQELQVKFSGQQEKLQSDMAVQSAKVEQDQQRIELQARSQESNEAIELMRLDMQKNQQQFSQMLDMMKAQHEKINSLASALNNIRSATGADVIASQSAVDAFEDTAQEITE